MPSLLMSTMLSGWKNKMGKLSPLNQEGWKHLGLFQRALNHNTIQFINAMLGNRVH